MFYDHNKSFSQHDRNMETIKYILNIYIHFIKSESIWNKWVWKHQNLWDTAKPQYFRKGKFMRLTTLDKKSFILMTSGSTLKCFF